MASTFTESVEPAFLAESRVPEILVGSILPPAIATVFVLARFYSRGFILQNWGYDDTWILVSWLLGGIVLPVLNSLLTAYGAGRHIQAPVNQDLSNITRQLELAFASQIIYQLCLMTTKIAICEFYRRIFSDRRSRIFVWCMIASVVLFTVPLIFSVVFQCSPVKGAWRVDIPSKCTNQTPTVYASTILNVLADILLLVFIVPRISNLIAVSLKIARKQKASLLLIVSLSLLAMVAGIVRLARVLNLFISKDTSWDSYDIAIWSSVEINTGLFCASAAAIKPLLRKIAPRVLSSISTRTSRTVPSKNKLDAYGGSKHRSIPNAIEPTSQPDLRLSPGASATTNTLWADGETRGQVLGLNSSGDIRKTVSMMVPDHSYDDFETGRARVEKFEHV